VVLAEPEPEPPKTSLPPGGAAEHAASPVPASATTATASASASASASAVAAKLQSLKSSDQHVLVLWCVCVGLVLSVGGLCSFHLYLILHNLTTLELFAWFGISKAEALVWRNPYDAGSKLGNFQAVFGSGRWYLALLPSARKPPPLKVSAYVGPGGNAWDGSWANKDGKPMHGVKV